MTAEVREGGARVRAVLRFQYLAIRWQKIFEDLGVKDNPDSVGRLPYPLSGEEIFTIGRTININASTILREAERRRLKMIGIETTHDTRPDLQNPPAVLVFLLGEESAEQYLPPMALRNRLFEFLNDAPFKGVRLWDNPHPHGGILETISFGKRLPEGTPFRAELRYRGGMWQNTSLYISPAEDEDEPFRVRAS